MRITLDLDDQTLDRLRACHRVRRILYPNHMLPSNPDRYDAYEAHYCLLAGLDAIGTQLAKIAASRAMPPIPVAP